MKSYKILLLALVTILISACNKTEISQINSEEVMAMSERKENPSGFEIEKYCNENGGYYETWNDGETFCMFGGYGCDPEEFYFGRCGLGI